MSEIGRSPALEYLAIWVYRSDTSREVYHLALDRRVLNRDTERAFWQFKYPGDLKSCSGNFVTLRSRFKVIHTPTNADLTFVT